MAKHESDAAAKKERKESKKKRKHEESAAAEDDVEITKEQRKKDKKRKSSTEIPAATGVDEDGDVTIADAAPEKALALKEEGDGDVSMVKVEVPLAALVPFANPLCDDKSQKKVLKGVKRAAKSKALKRGVKECVKAIRKSPLAAPSTNPATATPPGIVVLAADISPMDVISHIPVLCEDHGIPYVYVPSRAELGSAGATKRPTSIVMVTPKVGKGAKEADEGEWGAQFGELLKLSVKLGQGVKV